ncbi:hypothetical protein OSTOST_18668, partial [Ostertagia ostertagi]
MLWLIHDTYSAAQNWISEEEAYDRVVGRYKNLSNTDRQVLWSMFPGIKEAGLPLPSGIPDSGIQGPSSS